MKSESAYMTMYARSQSCTHTGSSSWRTYAMYANCWSLITSCTWYWNLCSNVHLYCITQSLILLRSFVKLIADEFRLRTTEKRVVSSERSLRLWNHQRGQWCELNIKIIKVLILEVPWLQCCSMKNIGHLKQLFGLRNDIKEISWNTFLFSFLQETLTSYLINPFWNV